ncbi:hypothetical protein [Neolewinella agarilytica]|uniref:Uncharacterized protein n=1 Tax=Neolewinella agarilytica TaxID=478744 RepID=A0A1H9J3B8_9BACT|nr:hypothetical protein [Neolewinella agarilytica]SEQ81354.1 hypothetical protein SAMN05444359_11673 [Neolewinella agarilytica]
MLKKLSFLLAACLIVMTGCKDDELAPVIIFNELEVGAFPFLNELKTGEFDLADLAGSAYEMDVYFVDGQAGANIAQYNVYVTFEDNNPSNGDESSTAEALFRSYVPSDFETIGDKGNLGTNVVIPFLDAATAAGVDADNVLSGDRFQFRTEIVTTTGTTFNSVNSTPAVTNAFGGLWNFNVTATCPLADDVFVGSYNVSYGYIYDPFVIFGRTIQGWLPAPMDQNVTLELKAGSTTVRSFGTQYLVPSDLTSDITIDLTFSCDVVTAVSSDSGVRCSGAGWRPIQINTASFDLNDDSTFTIEFRDWGSDENNGGCGNIAAQEYSVVFVKQ